MMSDLNSSGGRELRLAAIGGDVDAVIRRLQAGDPVDAVDSYGFTPLMVACKHDHLDVVRVLLDSGANARRVNSVGSSAVKFAVRCGNEVMVALLLEDGANANESYKHGALLDYAVSLRAADDVAARIVHHLLAHGADPNRTTGLGVNALNAAAKLGRVAMVRELIAAGAHFRNRAIYRNALTFRNVQNDPELHRLLEPMEPSE